MYLNIYLADNSIGNDVYMVFEYVDTDLSGLMDMAREGGIPWFNETQIKCYMFQVLQALKYIHDKNIVHRDLKSSNILITEFNIVKLADFGLSRQIGLDREYTNNVITRWYRPPELLLGCTRYNKSIDMWSFGCIIAELLIGRSPFVADNDKEQLAVILSVCGTPTIEDWPEAYEYSRSGLLDQITPHERKLKEHLTRIAKDRHGPNFELPNEVWDLIDKLLVLNPNKRLDTNSVLEHPWFKEVINPKLLPRIPVQSAGEHEFQTKKRKIT